MFRTVWRVACVVVSFTGPLAACGTRPEPPPAVEGAGTPDAAAPRSTKYDDLVALFTEWRTFQRPSLVEGVPDYSANAMAAQHKGLGAFQARLNAIDPASWPVPQQVDYYVVRAEMHGLDFDQRVLRPWANNPAFYVTVFPDESDQPAREGPFAYGAVELWTYPRPLSPEAWSTIVSGLRTIPTLLAQAKSNLVGTGHDLWQYGITSIEDQAAALSALAVEASGAPADVRAAVEAAQQATVQFAAWLRSELPRKSGPSGIGVENYDWYLKHVQLAPYTWQQQVLLMERELARAHAFLALEEQRNAGLPAQTPIASAGEHARRFGAAVTEYMAFLRDRRLLTIHDDMDAAVRARIGGFSAGPREFFSEVDYRDPLVMRTHGYHWFDKARMRREPHASPIRQGPLLYNIFVTRTEGHATGWEEWMLQAGMFDARPRSRELIYVLLAERAARALGDLRMHGNEFTLEEAAVFTSANTPRGWLSLEGALVRGEQHLYLQQPAYGTSYVIGKMEIDRLLQTRTQQLGARFDMRQFMEAFDAAGLVPASLLRWELTGDLPADVARMLDRQ